MSRYTDVAPATSDRELIITRTFNAPRELVFKVWTDPQHLGRWWGPTGFTTTTHEMDLRIGGTWRFTMHGPDGVDHENRIVFTGIVEPEYLAYTHGGGEAGDDELFQVTVTFADADGKTRVAMRMLFMTAEERERQVVEVGAIAGANQTLDRLQELLATLE